ncbi:hypothetical protein NP493_103g05000 [Ridgeia piscesae]|uniref:Uncharacterized protein n=1 Tax=Ridgeia piscesae TaxID=27915 RepID=A0AAD9UHM1_RIDPI|nr:hypothetical protein NP493_103g05000 [Ridgeia piscesae]
MSVVAVTVWLCVVAAMAAASPTESPTNNFPLDLEELAKLGIDTDKLLDYLKRLAEGNYMCGVRDVPGMQRHFLRNSTPTCNDGSPAG